MFLKHRHHRYVSPKDEVFFFVNNRGAWQKLCGPLSRKQYDLAQSESAEVTSLTSRSGKERKAGTLLTRCHFDLINTNSTSSASRSGNERAEQRTGDVSPVLDGSPSHGGSRKSRSSSFYGTNALDRLAGAGEVYMSNKSNKLFVCYPAEHVVAGALSKGSRKRTASMKK